MDWGRCFLTSCIVCRLYRFVNSMVTLHKVWLSPSNNELGRRETWFLDSHIPAYQREIGWLVESYILHQLIIQFSSIAPAIHHVLPPCTRSDFIEDDIRNLLCISKLLSSIVGDISGNCYCREFQRKLFCI